MSSILKIGESEFDEVLSYFQDDVAERRSREYLENIKKELNTINLTKDYYKYLGEKSERKGRFLFIGLPEEISCIVNNQERDILLPVTDKAEKKIEEVFDYLAKETIEEKNKDEQKENQAINYFYFQEKAKQIIRAISYIRRENFNAKVCIKTKNFFENGEKKFNLIINMKYHPLSYTVENLHETMKSIYLCLKTDLEESINKNKTIEAIVKENEVKEFEVEFLRIENPIIKNHNLINLMRDEQIKNEKIKFYRIYLFDYAKTGNYKKNSEQESKREEIKRKNNKGDGEQLF